MSFKTQAAELYNRNLSIRALGMGNAYTAVVRDIDSVYYNPAGLSYVNGFNLTLLKLRAGINDLDVVTDIQDLTDSDNLEDVLRNFYGRPLSVNVGATVGLLVHGFAFVAYDSLNVSADLSNPALPDFQLDYINDMGFASGVGFELIPGIMRLGIVGKRISRLGASETISVDTLASLETDELEDRLKNEGVGYAMDAGLNFSIPSPLSPTISVVMRDIGNTKFSHIDGEEAPPTDKSELIVGAAMELSIPGVSITPAIDFRYLTDDREIALGKKINFGVEIGLPLIDLRGGFHQGYYTAGASFNMGLAKIDAATYGVELGEYPGQHEDRRYMIEMTIDFGWDGSGNIFGVTRETRRKLKQRR